MRLAEGNTQCLVKVLDLLKELFSHMQARDAK